MSSVVSTRAFLVALGLLFSGCVTTHQTVVPVAPPSAVSLPAPQPMAINPAKPAHPATPLVRLTPDQVPLFDDDTDTTTLRIAAAQSAGYYHQLPPDQLFQIGDDTYTARDLAGSMDYFVQLLDGSREPGDWIAAVLRDYIVYQSVGVGPDHHVTYSSYYEPTIPARLKRDARYRYPLYGRPADLVDVDLGLFNDAYHGVRIVGRREGRALVPYASRRDIDSGHELAGQNLEIAWAKDPLDIFFLQIEGSGWLDPGNGPPVRIHYDGDNGLRYQSVGLYMISQHLVPAGGFGHDALVRYMREHPKERQDILNVDERYIFFKVDQSTNAVYAYGNIDVPLTAGRSIATDPKIFPKGILVWVELGSRDRHTTGPVIPKASGALSIHRFMLNQDEGGAIQGPGRVDFFAGHGPAAEQFATHVWHPGRLFVLVKKPS